MLRAGMTLRFRGRELDAASELRDGTHRASSLDATWRRFSPAMAAAGITRIAELTGLDSLGVPVFAAIRPLGRSLSTQQGKGATPAAARVSALMESLETWTAEHLALPVVRGSYRSLVAARGRSGVIDVRRLPRPRGRLALDARWRWVEGADLVSGAPVLVPEQAVSLDMTFTRPPVFDMSSNGLASGNVLVEAIAHGLAEVIERDAEAAWRRRGDDRRIVLDSIEDAQVGAMIAQITATGARVVLWDLGSDTGVPVIGCAIMEDPREPAWRTLGFYQGFGAHLVPEIAVLRALTEAAQTRLTYIAGGRDDFFPADYARATAPALLADIWAQLSQPGDEPVVFGDLPQPPPLRSLGHELELLVERVTAQGRTQIVVVDLTHAQLAVPVVKVLVPGRATDVEAMG